MLIKSPKPKYRKYLRRGILTILAGEALCCAVSFGVWSKVNSDRGTRKYLKDNYPSILEAYYQVGEFLDSKNNGRHIDNLYWVNEG